MTIEIHNLDACSAALVFDFVTKSVPVISLKDLTFAMDQRPDGVTFDLTFRVIKPFLHITIYEEKLEIENQSAVCRVPVTEFSHIEIF